MAKILKKNGKIIERKATDILNAPNEFDVNGKKTGYWTYLLKNKKAKEGVYVAGVRQGEWKIYEHGELKYTGQYKDGIPVGDWLDSFDSMTGLLTKDLKRTGLWTPSEKPWNEDITRAAFYA
jgi:antitoxin component YwqK of YwqJK toxin-antitoxin module